MTAPAGGRWERAFLRAGEALQRRGLDPQPDVPLRRLLARCPACPDDGQRPGRPLSVWVADDRALRVDCAYGCAASDVVAAVPGLAASGPASDARPDGEAGRPDEQGLRFVSAAELRAATPELPERWVLEGYLAPGALTLTAGKPKTGKSTLAWSVAEAVAAGAETFLGRRVGGGAVVYVSEEGAGTLAHKLPATDRVRVLTRDAAWPKPMWHALIAAAVAEAQRVGAVLLVIDALSFWAGLAEGQENDAAVAQRTMDALGAATRVGLAVLLVHHQRKSGGEEGDAVRGAGAILGAADAVIELERLGEDAPPGQRRLVGVSRWAGAMPAVLVVERETTGAWRAVGEAVGRAETRAVGLRQQLLHAASSGDDGGTEDELAELVGLDKRKIGEPLRALVADGLLERSGEGRKGDPYRYRRAPEDAAPEMPPDGAGSIALEMLPRPYRGAASNAEGARPGAGPGDTAPWPPLGLPTQWRGKAPRERRATPTPAPGTPTSPARRRSSRRRTT